MQPEGQNLVIGYRKATNLTEITTEDREGLRGEEEKDSEKGRVGGKY